MYKIPAKTLFLGKKLIYVPHCHSTNKLASEIAGEKEFQDGTVIITDHQTHGRGQRGNTWEAEQGKNFTFTILFSPTFLLPMDQFYLNMVISLGITDYIFNLFQRSALIKWPNDILFNEKKVGGILIENQISGNRMTSSFVGIGLNMNQEKFDDRKASSLRHFSGVDFSLNNELPDLLNHIESRYISLKAGKTKALASDYHERLFGAGEWRKYLVGEKEINGKIEGVDSTGRLLLETNSGVNSYELKEIRFIY
ncbi:MAG: biotin--[acetyl-CoA-carboxylase] ligase [Flammeovirgaceae bacterium]|nr:biotin--[acetyl-CoA-carboxylase] ligase [Flammeovirgaceae bacterium]